MKLTATLLTTQFKCPYLRYLEYEVKQPLPFLGGRRRLGNLVHAARAAYEGSNRSLDRGLEVLEERRQHLAQQGTPLESSDFAEAGSGAANL